jgi:hypothetical protein
VRRFRRYVYRSVECWGSGVRVTGRRDCDALTISSAVHRIAGGGDFAGRGSRRCGGAVGAQARDQSGDLLPLEVEVRRRWRAERKRLRELEAENDKLKRMYADLALENSTIKEVLNRKL